MSFNLSNVKAFIVGLLAFILTSLNLFLTGMDFAGTQSDSEFYMRMFQNFSNQFHILQLEDYEVASGPIYVHLLGLLVNLIPFKSPLIIQVIYAVFAVLTVYFLIRILESVDNLARLILIVIITSSGYFVAPVLHPTSDAAANLFLISTIYFFKEKRNLSFSICSALLVSTRQSFGWIIVAFLIYDFMNKWPITGRTFIEIVRLYLPSILSLVLTFYYFEYHLTPVIYLNSQPQNTYQVPNLLGIFQIGFIVATIFVPLILLGGIKLSRSVNRAGIYIFAFLYLVFSFYSTRDLVISDGMGFLSLFVNRFNLPVSFIIIVSLAGFLIFSQFLIHNKLLFNEITLFILIFCLSTTIMPIPFLRYFYVTFVILLIWQFSSQRRMFTEMSKISSSLIGIYFFLYNMAVISLK